MNESPDGNNGLKMLDDNDDKRKMNPAHRNEEGRESEREGGKEKIIHTNLLNDSTQEMAPYIYTRTHWEQMNGQKASNNFFARLIFSFLFCIHIGFVPIFASPHFFGICRHFFLSRMPNFFPR